LLAVGIGILVAVVLVCTVPLYISLVSNVQLQRAIHASAPSARNIQATADSDNASATQRDAANATVTSLAQRYLSSFTTATPTHYLISDNLLLFAVGAQKFDPSDPRARQVTYEAFDYTAAASHMRFIAGGAPQSVAGGAPQAIVTKEMADAFHMTVGTSLTVIQFGDHSINSTVKVSGIWQPVDAADPYWNGLDFSVANATNPSYPVLITYDSFFSELTPFTGTAMHQDWIYYTRPDAITTGNMNAVASDIGAFRARMNGDVLAVQGIGAVNTQSTLDQTISDIQAQQALLALPLYVIIAQIVGLALLFVAAMSALLVEGQNQEIATLKSRGASGSQLLSTFTTQGVVLSLLAAIAGPFLAGILALWLIRKFVAASVLQGSGISSTYLTQLASPTAVLLPALVGALLGLITVTVTAWQSARMDVLAFRREQGRSTRVPFWRRYYLDLALVVLFLAGYLELNQFGGTSTRQQLGGGGNTPLLLITPALLLLAGSLLVLRVLPLGAQFGARVAARGRGLTSLLAFAQVERNPARYSRMTLLLVLAVGLGLFALTFDASLTRNVHDRSAYSVGADMRVVEATGLGNGKGQTMAQNIALLPGVQAVSPALRTSATTTSDLGNNAVDLLAIDPTTFGQPGAVSWRHDYAAASLDSLLSGLRAHALAAPVGPGTPEWAIISDVFAAQYHLTTGDQFTLSLTDASSAAASFTVGAIVHEFPTLYPQGQPGSFIVVGLNDYVSSVKALTDTKADTSKLGPNEFWLRTTSDPAAQQKLLRQLAAPAFRAQQTLSLSQAIEDGIANPVSAGMRGLLLVGAITAALLAVLGSLIQSILATRQRARQFAVLRTVGMSGRQLTGLLLGEQIVVYLFGLVGGTLLGLLLTTATLPFLQFSDTTIDPSTLGIPAYVLTFNGQTVAYFYASLLAAFVFALLIAARYATGIGLGKTLRLGED
jgi:putative ABC transport system permease protein